jgi:hypothetical protein
MEACACASEDVVHVHAACVLYTHSDDLFALLFADEAALVDVVHAEGPAQPLLRAALRRDAHRRQELAEVQLMVDVPVESSEHVLSKLGGVSVGEVLDVDVFELVDA